MKRLITIAASLLNSAFAIASSPASAYWYPRSPTPLLSAAPSILISRDQALVRITFTGALQVADAITGPWTDLSAAASPYTPPAPAAPKFYRTWEPGSIFSSSSVVDLSMIGPFQSHFEKAFAGMPDGIFPPVREKPYFDGTIRLAGLERPVTMRVRGNSSLQECPFPKLKFKISREQRAGTPFFDAREIKVGTHCAEGGYGTIGRLRHETATFREALAYETMTVLGFTSPRVRRARIEYHDTTPTNAMGEVGWNLHRSALILDDTEVIGERLGGRALDDEEVAALTNAGFDDQLLTDLRLFHALLGNWDYALAQEGRELWNTEVIELSADGKARHIPIAADFDLSSWVTGMVQLEAPWDYHPELPDLERQARFEVEQIRNRVSPPTFSAGTNRFVQKRAEIESHLQAALVDEPGRTNAVRHVNAFFDAIAALIR